MVSAQLMLLLSGVAPGTQHDGGVWKIAAEIG